MVCAFLWDMDQFWQKSQRRLHPLHAIESTDLPGAYRAEIATRDQPAHEEPRLAFVIAAPASESDLLPGEAPAQLDTAEAANVGGTVIRQPLAPWFFLLVGLLAIAEAGLRLRRPSRA